MLCKFQHHPLKAYLKSILNEDSVDELDKRFNTNNKQLHTKSKYI